MRYVVNKEDYIHTYKLEKIVSVSNINPLYSKIGDIVTHTNHRGGSFSFDIVHQNRSTRERFNNTSEDRGTWRFIRSPDPLDPRDKGSCRAIDTHAYKIIQNTKSLSFDTQRSLKEKGIAWNCSV